MTPTGNESSDEAMASTRSAASPRRARARWCRAGVVVVALLGTGVLAAACGGGPSAAGVASVGKATTTAGSAGAQSGNRASVENGVLAYVNCMRTHGEPNMPDPSVDGNSLHVSATPGSGFDPNSPQFAAASSACQHVLPKVGGTSAGNTITPADQADYLKAVACMRTHGVPNFPDPVFQSNSVQFNDSATPIDTNSSQYKSALATCQKLIPAGLPFSSTSGS